MEHHYLESHVFTCANFVNNKLVNWFPLQWNDLNLNEPYVYWSVIDRDINEYIDDTKVPCDCDKIIHVKKGTIELSRFGLLNNWNIDNLRHILDMPDAVIIPYRVNRERLDELNVSQRLVDDDGSAAVKDRAMQTDDDPAYPPIRFLRKTPRRPAPKRGRGKRRIQPVKPAPIMEVGEATMLGIDEPEAGPSLTEEERLAAAKALEDAEYPDNVVAVGINIHGEEAELPIGGTSNSYYMGFTRMVRDNGHLGDHSIEPNGVTEFIPFMDDTQQQNALSTIDSMSRGRRDGLQYKNHTVIISGKVALPMVGMQQPERMVSTTYQRTIPAQTARTLFEIYFTAPLIIGTMPMAAGTAFMTGGAPNVRTIGNSVRGCSYMHRNVAEGIAAAFDQGRDKHNNSTLWTILGILEDCMLTYERLNMQPRLGNVSAGGITTANLNVTEPAHITEVVNIAVDAIAHGRITICGRHIIPSDWCVIYALTTGTQYLRPPHAGRVIPMHVMIETPGIEFFIWDEAPIQLPAPEQFTSEQVRACGNILAGLLGEHDAAAQGYCRAASIINGVVHRERAPRGRQIRLRLITAALEIRGTSLPRPRGHNFFWRVLGIDKTMNLPTYFLKEYHFISARNCQERQLIGAAYATLLSLGVSSIFQNWNLTGRELNSWARRIGQRNTGAASLIDSLVESGGTVECSDIYPLACSLASQISPITLNATCFHGANWTGLARGLDELEEHEGWHGLVGIKSPYIARPESLSWLITSWAHLWGITHSHPKINFASEFILSSIPANSYIDFSAGESKYESVILSGYGYQYVPYGVLAYNILRQQTRTTLQIPVSYHRQRLDTQRLSITDPQWLEQAELQPLYDDDIYQVIPGSMPTYDWTDGSQLRPYLRAQNIPPTIWNLAATTNTTECQRAGFITRFAPTVASMY